MLHTKFYRNSVQTTLRCLNRHISYKNTKAFLSNHNNSRIRHLRMVSSPNFMQCRNYLNESQSQVQLPALSSEPPVMWPSFFKTLNNFIQCNFVIRPLLDKEFNMPEFLEGSKQAVSVVSKALANEDYESISDLVTPDVIQTLKNKINTFNPEQKQLIAVNKEDIYLTFPHQVGIMFDNDRAHQRFVEITVVHHSLRGLERMRAENKEPPMNMGMMPEYQRLLFACNYRYVREFTKGVESSWTINMVNHFMLATV